MIESMNEYKSKKILDEYRKRVNNYASDGISYCSFCGWTEKEVGQLIIAGDGMALCRFCIKDLYTQIRRENAYADDE